jgi:hypothetical protein
MRARLGGVAAAKIGRVPAEREEGRERRIERRRPPGRRMERGEREPEREQNGGEAPDAGGVHAVF